MNINEKMKLHKWAQDMAEQKSSVMRCDIFRTFVLTYTKSSDIILS